MESVGTQASPPWGLDRIDQRLRPLDGFYTYGPAGTTVHVHVIDSGIRTSHTEFGGRAFIGGDYIDDDGDGNPTDVGNDDGNPAAPDGTDCTGHGTHVAGTIGGVTFGVAKFATLYAHRVLGCIGLGPTSGVIAAVDAVTANPDRPAVANMSLGGSPSAALDAAVSRSIAAGVTYVIAAGNDGGDAGSKSPSRVSEAIVVGATNASDIRASFSNFGPLVDLFAPGVGILSAWFTSDTAVAQTSGTSMAAPHVTGVVATYLQAVGHRSPATVREAIVSSATAGVVGSAGAGSPNLLLYSEITDPPPSATPVNVAHAAEGASAVASSSFSGGYAPSGAINGDRRGVNWGAGGGWNDGTGGIFPDWIEVAFNGVKTIDSVNVFTVQDNYASPSEPTPTMTFSQYGLRDFSLQYWTGTEWRNVAGGVVRGNTLVWRALTFAPVTTQRIRILAELGLNTWSRIAEIEAYEAQNGPNAAPIVSLTAPADGTLFSTPAIITIAATASDSDGIRDVAFYVDGALIGEDTTSPYSWTWGGASEGRYTLIAVATDNAGAMTASDAVLVDVLGAAPRPNVALAAAGATATSSSTYHSGYAAAGAINGDRRGLSWGAGGGWNDATPNTFPDWLQITFNGPKTIDSVNVFSVQDNYASPNEPTSTMTFALYGLVDFTVHSWTGSAWQPVPGGVVRGNTLVWRTINFAPVTTTAILVVVERGQDVWSRITEVEAYEPTGSNAVPVVTMTAPTDGAVFAPPATFVLSADASDSDGTIGGGAFYANGVLIGTDSASPYAITWTGVPEGSYSLAAVATDNVGATTTSAPVAVTVTPGTPRVNVALAANGAIASASSSYSPGYGSAGAINGDRRGVNWGAGGGWNDATANSFPDWLEVAFNGSKTIDTISVVTVQDNYTFPSEPTPDMTASLYGLRDFTAEYWTGSSWQPVPGGVVRGNMLVIRTVTFSPVTTTRIRQLAERSADIWSRIVELEAYQVP